MFYKYWMYEYTAKITKVVDGDTLDLEVDLGFHVWIKQRVRLLGIDTPETHTLNLKEKELGLKAKSLVEAVAHAAKIIKINTTKSDKYGRMLVVLTIDGVNINQKLITEGLAWTYDGGTKDKNLSDIK